MQKTRGQSRFICFIHPLAPSPKSRLLGDCLRLLKNEERVEENMKEDGKKGLGEGTER